MSSMRLCVLCRHPMANHHVDAETLPLARAVLCLDCPNERCSGQRILA